MSSTGTLIVLSERYASGGACWKCGVTIVMPENFYNKRVNDHEAFYCVNGHSAKFGGKSETERKLEAAEQYLANQKVRLELAEAEAKRAKEEQAAAEKRASAAKGEVTKIKNRVGNGVCPCCNRTFQNLMRHMNTKHPEFKEGKT